VLYSSSGCGGRFGKKLVMAVLLIFILVDSCSAASDKYCLCLWIHVSKYCGGSWSISQRGSSKSCLSCTDTSVVCCQFELIWFYYGFELSFNGCLIVAV
jgi:hypothetical protein